MKLIGAIILSKESRGMKYLEGYWGAVFFQSKRANIAVDPLLTNPLNSCTKLQISTT